jgi:hypothetical protein
MCTGYPAREIALGRHLLTLEPSARVDEEITSLCSNAASR